MRKSRETEYAANAAEMWTIISAVSKRAIMKKITMYEKMQKQPSIEKSLKLADERYHIKEIKEGEQCSAEDADS